MSSEVQLLDNLDMGAIISENGIDAVIPAEEALIASWLSADVAYTAAGGMLPQLEVQADAMAPAEEDLLASWLTADDGFTVTDGTLPHHFDDVAQQDPMLYKDPVHLPNQQQSGSNPWMQSPAPLLPLPTYPPGPLADQHPSAPYLLPSPLLQLILTLPQLSSFEASPTLLGSGGPLLNSPTVGHPLPHTLVGLPPLLTPSPDVFWHQADNSQAALAGQSPDSAKSATVAMHNMFSQQAVTPQTQPQGQQRQAGYQEPYQGQQNQWQQGQGHLQQPYQEQQSQGPFLGSYQEQFHAQPLQGQLWGQSVSHSPHWSSSQGDGLYSHAEPQDMGGTRYPPAAAEVAAPRQNSLESHLSNASCASHASSQHGASGMFTSQTQPRMTGQCLGQKMDMATSAALLPSIGASGSGQKRKAHEGQVHEGRVDYLDIAMEEMLAGPPTVSGACWTDNAGNSSGAACADGGSIDIYRAQLQVWVEAQRRLAAAVTAAAAKTWQPEKKQKTGVTSSRAVHRALTPKEASGPTQSPSMVTAPSLAQGLPVAAPSSHGHPSRAPPPRPPQAPSPASSSLCAYPHGNTPPLQSTGGILQARPRVPQQSSATPLAQVTSQRRPPAGSLSQAPTLAHHPTPAHHVNASRPGPSLQPHALSPLGPLPLHTQAQPQAHHHPQPQAQPQACRSPQAQPRVQARVQAQPLSDMPLNHSQALPHAHLQPRHQPQGEPQAQMTASLSNPATAPAAAPAQGSGYEDGQVVWAKFGSYPWWPAIVRDPTPAQRIATNMGSDSDKVFLIYHGTGEIGVLAKENVKQWGARKAPTKGKRSLQDAVRSAQQAINRGAV